MLLQIWSNDYDYEHIIGLLLSVHLYIVWVNFWAYSHNNYEYRMPLTAYQQFITSLIPILYYVL
jgi:hypothetical protein